MKKITLPEFYESLPNAKAPKTEFIDLVISKCGVRLQSVQNWVKKGKTPSKKEHCDVIAEITGVPAEELFPLYKENFLSDEKH